MRLFQKTVVGCLLFALVAMVFSPSCGKKAYVEELDTLRGMWGSVSLYNEWGNSEDDNSDVMVTFRCVDTLSSNPLTVLDTTFRTITDANGKWELDKPMGGWYFIEYSKSGYCKNAVYAHYHDTSRADTIAVSYLTKPAQGSVDIESITLDNGVLSINRTLHFTANHSSYSLATWYFFGRSESVSADDYVYSYFSGSSTASGNSQQAAVVYKPIDKLLESGFQEGETVYVRAYCDNARAVSYQVGEDEWIYPNLVGESGVLSFEIPEEEEEE